MNYKFTLSAGALIRKRIRNEIEKYCLIHDVKCRINEFKEMFSSEFVVELSGDEYEINRLVNWLKSVST